jgi:putative tricarboxylic transport membrane protein
MATSKKKELLIGVAMLGTGLGYLLMTSQLPRHDGIDAAFVPSLLSAMLCLLGFLQLLSVRGLATAVAEGEVEGQAPASSDFKTVLKTLALIVGYIALLNPVGFPIMTAIYLYLQFIVLTPLDHRVNHLAYALIALVTSAITYLLFREAFDLMLPSGLLPF